MKKVSILLVGALVAGILFTSCNKSKGGEKVDLKTQKDSLSYAYGVGYGSHILGNYLKGDSAGKNYDALLKGIKEGLDSKDTSLSYYALGLNIGAQLKKDAEKGLMADSSLTMDLEIIKKALFGAIEKKKLQITDDQANIVLQSIVEKEQQKQMSQKFGKNKVEGEQFLAQNKTKQGVVTTASGLQYEVVKTGNGPKPKATDKVKVNYKGTLINGTVFDSSKEPVTFPVNQVIKGWQEALQLMPVGSKWKIYIPQELAYGARSQSPIPPFSALVFEVELLSIEK
jgi:FKBP-type peptidyl-prolyl cis-trans isomerase FkpA